MLISDLPALAGQHRLPGALALSNLALHNISEAVVITDATQSDHPIVYCNPSFERLTGYSSTEVLGRNCRFLQGADTNPAIRLELQRALTEERSCRVILKNYRKDGSSFWSQVSISPVRNEEGWLTHFIGVQEDVTERLWLESMCQEVMEQRIALEIAQLRVVEMQKLAELKDEFISTVSHELRTPLSNMNLAIHMLAQQSPPEQQHPYLKILERECGRETELINDLLDLQRLDSGKCQPLLQEPIQVGEWLESIGKSFAARAQERGLELSLSPCECTIAAERRSLERVVSELLNNACKYTPAGEQVHVQAGHGADGSFVLRVCNTGVEIPLEFQERIFERFYRMPDRNTLSQGGTGLGLGLVRKLVQRMGGSIRVESGDGQTTFVLELPT